MEHQHTDTALPQPLSVQDQELFARVWRRVMPEEELSPICPGPAPTQPEAAPAAPAPLEAVPAMAPAAPVPQRQLSCLGQASMDQVPVLEELMEGAHSLWRSYQALSRRAQGRAARQLSELAADQNRNLRQLGAVYFLLTGERRQPSRPARAPMGGLGLSLRELFVQEQLGRQAYGQAAAQTGDSCLKALFQELEAESELHMDSIRHILEQM